MAADPITAGALAAVAQLAFLNSVLVVVALAAGVCIAWRAARG